VRAVLSTALGIAALAAGAAGCGGDGAPAAALAPAPAAPPAAAARPVAATPARSAPFVLVADSAADGLWVRAAPGQLVELGLRLANGADAPRAFALRSDLPWIEVPAAVEAPARQSVPVRVALRVPADAGPGRRRALVVARAGGDPAAALAVSYESSVPVAIEVLPGGNR
jgi:hypothetical protein